MPRRWLAALGLTLAAGCAGGGPPQDDASTDTPSDHATADDVGATKGDARRDALVLGGGGDTGEPSGDVSDTRPDADAGLDAEARPASDALGDADADAAAVAVQSICPAQIPVITVPSGPVKGVLTGPSNNPVVSCQGGVVTPGPDAFYTLKLTAAATIDLHVTAPVETVVSVRSGPCSDSISEIACGQDPALDVLPNDGATGAAGFANTGAAGFLFPPTPPKFDAGFGVTGAAGATGATGPSFDDAGNATDADASSLPESDLRVRLAAGTYTVVIDTFTPSPLTQASYTLTVGALTPAPNATCATPTLLASGTTATDQSLDLAGAPATVCGSTVAALYYSVGVPPGQRLTARATPKLGDRAWMPRLEAFTACSSGTCLAQGHASSGTTQELDWINNGTDWQLVDLAVASDGPVSGATFDLNVFVLDLSATCTRPTPVKDGTTLLGQDLSIAPSTPANTCNGDTDHAFYYSATLLPLQSIEVVLAPTVNQNSKPFGGPSLGMISSCDPSAQCSGGGNVVDFTNGSNQSTTILLVVSPNPGLVSTLFDLHVSMPPPPAQIVVTPTSGLVTSQSGQTATFQVGLTSPPTANISIAITSDTPTEGTASPATVTFTPSNWTTSQTVTVTGVDDGLSDGSQAYKIVTSAAVSTDGRYSGMNPDDVSVTNLNTHPGVLVQDADDVVTSESGATSSFTVQLTSAPTATVTLPLSSSDVAEGTVSPASLIFTPSNWNVPQTVTARGVDDAVADGTQAYMIVTGTIVSSDPSYGGQNPPDIAAHNLDDDYAPVGVKLLSGEHSCNSTNRFPLAIDELNQIYVVMPCEMGLWLSTSTDGGVTFSDPVLIPNTDNATSGQVELGAGSGGYVYLAYQGNSGSSWFLRSTDGGSTWSAPSGLANPTNTLHLAAARRTVAVLTDAPGGNSTFLWRSVDGGATFPSPTWIPDTNLTIGVSADATTEWLLETVGNTTLSKSTDTGQTFTTVGNVGASLFPVVFGKQSLFGISNGEFLTNDLADLMMLQQPVSFFLEPLALTVDDVDTATVVDIDQSTNRLRATQVSATASTNPVGGPKLIGPNGGPAGTVALSRKAVAVAFNAGSVTLFTTVTFP